MPEVGGESVHKRCAIQRAHQALHPLHEMRYVHGGPPVVDGSRAEPSRGPRLLDDSLVVQTDVHHGWDGTAHGHVSRMWVVPIEVDATDLAQKLTLHREMR